MQNKVKKIGWRSSMNRVCVSGITKDHPSVLGDGNNFLLAKTSRAAKTKIPALISPTEVWPEMLTELKFHPTC